jgi:hypothetical protein
MAWLWKLESLDEVFINISLPKKTLDQERFMGINFLEHKHASMKPRLGMAVCQALDMLKEISILPLHA